MQVQFKKPVTIGTATYGKGVHDVPAEDTKNNWFFDALVEEGSAIVLRGEESQESQESQEHVAQNPSKKKSKGV